MKPRPREAQELVCLLRVLCHTTNQFFVPKSRLPEPRFPEGTDLAGDLILRNRTIQAVVWESDFGPRCVALGKSLTFAEPQVPPLKSRENISLKKLLS